MRLRRLFGTGGRAASAVLGGVRRGLTVASGMRAARVTLLGSFSIACFRSFPTQITRPTAPVSMIRLDRQASIL